MLFMLVVVGVGRQFLIPVIDTPMPLTVLASRIFSIVHFPGERCSIAAFSAGSLKASHPMGEARKPWPGGDQIAKRITAHGPYGCA